MARPLRIQFAGALYHVISQLVYAASARQISDVWVAGRRVVRRGELTTLDTREVIHKANEWRDRLLSLHRPGTRLEETAS